ncbi:hypothetical protein BG011_003911 [Mortierella polycephala]|uniref:Uncharacterized protein n=1 Tax=Mortierella polycephala TaxID=41804 RepID=A0A9P6U2C6_9FUNG|nr:hypothetical protein BG011_003911 [Mortierella polycephala]
MTSRSKDDIVPDYNETLIRWHYDIDLFSGVSSQKNGFDHSCLGYLWHDILPTGPADVPGKDSAHYRQWPGI